MPKLTNVLFVRCEPSLLNALDDQIAQDGADLSRAETARRILLAALDVGTPTPLLAAQLEQVLQNAVDRHAPGE
jgi:hypothetical protein